VKELEARADLPAAVTVKPLQLKPIKGGEQAETIFGPVVFSFDGCTEDGDWVQDIQVDMPWGPCEVFRNQDDAIEWAMDQLEDRILSTINVTPAPVTEQPSAQPVTEGPSVHEAVPNTFEERICIVDCGKQKPECKCRASFPAGPVTGTMDEWFEAIYKEQPDAVQEAARVDPDVQLKLDAALSVLREISHGSGMFGLDLAEDLEWAVRVADNALRALEGGE
jgi:hypothetical protein